LFDIAGKPQVFKITLIQAREHRDSQDLERALFLNGGLQHPVVAMHSGKMDPVAPESAHSAGDGLWYIKELEIRKDLLA
jgi:hypothetical protein